jgi:hypothetical protein
MVARSEGRSNQNVYHLREYIDILLLGQTFKLKFFRTKTNDFSKNTIQKCQQVKLFRPKISRKL